MGFTNVVWASRATEQLARDLTDGLGPASVGEAGAAWVRVANELTSVSTDYDKIVERLKTAWDSEGSAAVVVKLEEFGRWLQAVSLGAAANGQRAEEAAVANTVAILAMPTVSEALEAKAAHDMMASLAAYNGAILHGNFAEFDEAARADQANAAGVMEQYENAVAPLAQPWEQPLPGEISKGQALATESAQMGSEAGGGSGASGGAGGGAGVPMPLAPWNATAIKSTPDAKTLQRTAFNAGSAGTGMGGGGYGPMMGYGRPGDQNRDFESVRPAAALEGGGEPGAGLADAGGSWLPAAEQGDSAFLVSSVSWGPDSAAFDDLAGPDVSGFEEAADDPEASIGPVAERGVSLPVIGAGRQADS